MVVDTEGSSTPMSKSSYGPSSDEVAIAIAVSVSVAAAFESFYLGLIAECEC